MRFPSVIERWGETTLQSSKRTNLKRLARESRVHLQGLLRDPRDAASPGPGIDALCGLFMVFLPSGPVLALSFFVAKLGSQIRTPAHARVGEYAMEQGVGEYSHRSWAGSTSGGEAEQGRKEWGPTVAGR